MCSTTFEAIDVNETGHSCGVVSLLEDGDKVRLLPLLRNGGLLKRCPVDGSQDWCQLVGCLLQKPGQDRIWAGRFVSIEAAEQVSYPIDVDINPRQLRHCKLCNAEKE